jgi:hypothetical protein
MQIIFGNGQATGKFAMGLVSRWDPHLTLLRAHLMWILMLVLLLVVLLRQPKHMLVMVLVVGHHLRLATRGGGACLVRGTLLS